MFEDSVVLSRKYIAYSVLPDQKHPIQIMFPKILNMILDFWTQNNVIQFSSTHNNHNLI